MMVNKVKLKEFELGCSTRVLVFFYKRWIIDQCDIGFNLRTRSCFFSLAFSFFYLLIGQAVPNAFPFFF